MKNADIAVLVRKVQEDKANAFEALYKEIWNTVYYYCYKSLGNEQDAKDAMQTVFIELYKKFDTLYHPNAFNKFLFTIMKFTCSNFRKKKSRSETDEADDFESLPEDNTDFLPSEAFEKEEIRQEIAEMIGTLPAKQREAILLFYYDGLSIKEIAEITDSKFDAVNNRLVTARKTLRERAETLVKKGVLNRTMAVTPIPILTRILLEEAERVATPEICALAWQNISSTLDIQVTTGEAPPAEAAASATTAASATATGVVINIAIGIVIAAVIGLGAFFAYYVNDHFINPTAAATAQYNDQPLVTIESMTDIVIRIRAINNRSEFEDFIDTYGFTFLGGARSSDRGSEMLYYLKHQDQFVYLGYIEDLQNNFWVVYEVADMDMPRMESGDVGGWFAR